MLLGFAEFDCAILALPVAEEYANKAFLKRRLLCDQVIKKPIVTGTIFACRFSVL